MPVFIEQEGKLYGKRERTERKFGIERRTRLVIEKFALSQLRQKSIDVDAVPFRERDRPHEFFDGKLSADAAVLQVRLPLLQPQLQDAEVGAQRDAVGRHFADVEIDGAL